MYASFFKNFLKRTTFMVSKNCNYTKKKTHYRHTANKMHVYILANQRLDYNLERGVTY